MNKLNQALLKFQALTLRERVMTVAAIVVVLYFLTDFALLAPQQKKTKALQQQINQQKMEIDSLTKVLTGGATDTRPGDALVRVRAERDELRARVAQADSLMGQSTGSAPLSELIRRMIGARRDLTLASMKTLPVEVFFKPGAPAAAPAKPVSAAQPAVTAPPPPLTLYKHGVEVVVKGSYPALLSYLQGLQRDPNRLFWASVKLDVVAYPEATLKMTVYTLSDSAASPLG